MDTFKSIVSESFHNAVGDDNIDTGLLSGSKDPSGGNQGNVGDLQRALNKIGASPLLIDDGIFGALTKAAVLQLGYSYPVDAATFYKILGAANAGTPVSTTSAYHRVTVKKATPSPKKKTAAGNLFQEGLDLLQQKAKDLSAQLGKPATGGVNIPPPPPESKGLGTWAWVGIISGSVLLIGGIVYAMTRPKGAPQPIVVAKPQLAIAR